MAPPRPPDRYHRPVRTRIKFCGLVRHDDIALAASLGVDAIGFVFYPRSPRHLEIDEARRLRRWVPSYVAAVGLFVNAAPELVQQTAREVGLDVIQFHGDETAEQCQAARGTLPYWRGIAVRGPGDLLESFVNFGDVEVVLADAFSEGYGGSGGKFDWSWIPAVRAKPMFLSGGLSADDVGEAIGRVRPVGVDVSTGIQGDEPRVKDPDKMQRFVAAVMAADQRRGGARS